jgi:hypothetical protein
MSSETTTTTLNDLVHTEYIEPIFLDYAHDHVVASRFLKQWSLVGKSTAKYQVPRFASDMGTVGDNASGVDTEFGATAASDISSNTQLDTDSVTFTPAEYGLKHTVVDDVFEDSIMGAELMSAMVSNAARILQTAIEADVVALFSGLATAVGTSGSDLTLAQMISAADGIYDRGCRAPNGLVYVLDDEQYANVRDASIATSSAWATYPGASDRVLGIDAAPNHGLSGDDTPRMIFRGYPVYSTGLCATANTGANVVGACFTPTGPQNDPFVTFAMVTKRPFRVGTERDESLRATEVVFTTRVAVGEATDVSGTEITTDAP